MIETMGQLLQRVLPFYLQLLQLVQYMITCVTV